jgi:hypothetical protein
VLWKPCINDITDLVKKSVHWIIRL